MAGTYNAWPKSVAATGSISLCFSWLTNWTASKPLVQPVALEASSMQACVELLSFLNLLVGYLDTEVSSVSHGFELARFPEFRVPTGQADK